MNCDKARELVNHTWHYTRMNDDSIYPIGYCTDHDGHDTQQEAEECYKQYQLDNSLRLEGGSMYNTKVKCQFEDCTEYTDIVSYIDYEHFILCPTHRTKEIVSTMFDCGGESIHS